MRVNFKFDLGDRVTQRVEEGDNTTMPRWGNVHALEHCDKGNVVVIAEQGGRKFRDLETNLEPYK